MQTSRHVSKCVITPMVKIVSRLIEFIKNHVLINLFNRTNCNALVMIAVQKWNGLRRIKQSSKNQKFTWKTFFAFVLKSLVWFTRQLDSSNHTYSWSCENFLEFCIILQWMSSLRRRHLMMYLLETNYSRLENDDFQIQWNLNYSHRRIEFHCSDSTHETVRGMEHLYFCAQHMRFC